MDMARSRFASISRHLSSATKLRGAPTKYKSQAIRQAQQAVTDYLHNTRYLSYTYAEHIAENAVISLQKLMSKVHFSVPTFDKSLCKHLCYHPINEFEFFFESIGIEYEEVEEYLPPDKLFFSEDSSVLDAACALSNFGFPWNKLGKLYEEEISIFRRRPNEITSTLLKLKAYGFSTFALIGMCLAIPRVLCEDEEFHCLSANLKRVSEKFDSASIVEGTVDSWFSICRKLKVFYHLGGSNRKMWELMGRNISLFVKYPEEVFIQKTQFFCRFGVSKVDAALLILRNPEIMNFDLETRVISVTGILKHFGLSEDELETVAQKYPHVLGRNKMVNLPNVLRALDLHDWMFERLKNGDHHLLDSYSLVNPDEDLLKEYQEGVEEIQHWKTSKYNMEKLDFLHSIGFGQNALTLKVLQQTRGTCIDLQDRFCILVDSGIKFSKLCMSIRFTPKILNHRLQRLEEKLRFFFGEMGSSVDNLDVFPAFLCYDLEHRIKPRLRFHKWLVEKSLFNTKYCLSSIVAASEEKFLARLHGIHPALPKQWLECFYRRKTSEYL